MSRVLENWNASRYQDLIVNVKTSSLFSLVYVSSAVEAFSQADLLALLETSRRNNSSDGVTGMLLYKSGNFMQALEGEEETVRRIHERIRRDPRHRGLITLLEQRTAERQFIGWSMGFRDVTGARPREIPGYSEFLNVPLNDATFLARPSRAQKLLSIFRQKM